MIRPAELYQNAARQQVNRPGQAAARPPKSNRRVAAAAQVEEETKVGGLNLAGTQIGP